jgi:hypothetical protein
MNKEKHLTLGGLSPVMVALLLVLVLVSLDVVSLLYAMRLETGVGLLF